VNLKIAEDQNQKIAAFGSSYTYWSCLKAVNSQQEQGEPS